MPSRTPLPGDGVLGDAALVNAGTEAHAAPAPATTMPAASAAEPASRARVPLVLVRSALPFLTWKECPAWALSPEKGFIGSSHVVPAPVLSRRPPADGTGEKSRNSYISAGR